MRERAGRDVMPPEVAQRLGPASRDMAMAVMQWRWLKRARLDADGGWVLADFSPLKAAVRLEMAGRPNAARAAEALSRDALGDAARLVVLLPEPDVVVECWRRRGPNRLTAGRAQKLRQLVEAYRRYFARAMPWPTMAVQPPATDAQSLAGAVLQWLAGSEAGDENPEHTGAH